MLAWILPLRVPVVCDHQNGVITYVRALAAATGCEPREVVKCGTFSIVRAVRSNVIFVDVWDEVVLGLWLWECAIGRQSCALAPPGSLALCNGPPLVAREVP